MVFSDEITARKKALRSIRLEVKSVGKNYNNLKDDMDQRKAARQYQDINFKFGNQVKLDANFTLYDFDNSVRPNGQGGEKVSVQFAGEDKKFSDPEDRYVAFLTEKYTEGGIVKEGLFVMPNDSDERDRVLDTYTIWDSRVDAWKEAHSGKLDRPVRYMKINHRP